MGRCESRIRMASLHVPGAYPAHTPNIAAIASRSHWASMRWRISLAHIIEAHTPNIDCASMPWRIVSAHIIARSFTTEPCQKSIWRISDAYLERNAIYHWGDMSPIRMVPPDVPGAYPAHIPNIAAIASRSHWASMRWRISLAHIIEA